jgi:mRNA interferase HigB
MRIVSRKMVIDYYSSHSGSKTALEEWYNKVSKANWNNLNELKRDYLNADYVGNKRVVFNIKGNDYRLIAIIIYVSQKVYLRWIGTHAEYDKIEAKNL